MKRSTPDVLALSVRRDVADVVAEFDETVITVNGSELVEIVRATEQPFADAEGRSHLAGAYRGLPPSIAFLPSKHLLGNPDPLYADLVGEGGTDKPAVLVCTCGEAGCWPLCARITVSVNAVTWSDFEQPYRADAEGGYLLWSYEQLGPFTFDRAAYEQALRRTG